MIIAQESAAALAMHPDDRAMLADYLRARVRDHATSHGSVLARTTEHVLQAPGKLMRPRLLLDACRAAGGDPARAFPAAAGTEYGHIASLVHDDIIDGDAERRGQAAVHAMFTAPVAILTGDLFIFHTFLSYTLCHERGVSAERVLDAIRTLSLTCIEVCEGQALEAEIAGDLDTPEDTYLEMVRLKTAGVWRAAAEIGASLAEAPDTIVASLRAYGEHLGIAFQIVDDLLCYEGQPARLGKPLESDLCNGRVTLPVIYAIQAGGLPVRRELAALFGGRAVGVPTAYQRLVDVLEATGSLDRTRDAAERRAALASQHLDALKQTPARERLRAMVGLVVGRDH